MWPDVLRLWRSISTPVADLIAAAISLSVTDQKRRQAVQVFTFTETLAFSRVALISFA